MAKKKTEKEEPLEKQLWKAADKLRKNIDAAEYKHVVLGLIFLKYISDTFEELFAKLQAGEGDYAGADPEDKDEYKAENVFFDVLYGGFGILNYWKEYEVVWRNFKKSKLKLPPSDLEIIRGLFETN